MRVFLLIVAAAVASTAFAQPAVFPPAWNEPVEPFRILDNIYYVGAAEVTSFLIATPRGHILLDGGLPETVPIILRSIEKLGFKAADVRILINSHGHVDHAGGLAELKRVTGATFFATAGDVPLLARGGRDDPQFREKYPYPPVYADRILRDGQILILGGVKMTAHLTPGHTRGCTTWSMKAAGKDVLFLCSPTIPSEYRIVGNPLYPDAVSDYQRQFRVLNSLPCEVFLGAHASFFELEEKRKRRVGGDELAFVDPGGCASFIQRAEQRLADVVSEHSR
jgi:metallo-beta-lactamase class B